MITRGTAIVLVALGASSYGLLSPIVKLAYHDGLGDPQVSAGQITMGAVLIWLLVAASRKSWANPFRGPWIQLAVVGIAGIAMTTVMLNKSLSELDASLAIILLFQFTWITIVMEAVAAKRMPRRNQWLGVAAILVGTALAVNAQEVDWHRFSGSGLAFGLLASLTYSVFLFWTGRIRGDLPPLMRAAIMLTAALPFFYLIYPPTLVFSDHSFINVMVWGLALGLLGQVVPTFCFNLGIPRIGGSLSAMLGALELPVAL
ncbi:MAG: EamA family transporter, partial [Paenibacillaceae bacterium]|nr:EamA family transporter [Paenibacillaceae bacterium]